MLYTGVTSDVYERIKQHRERKYPNSFTAKYNLNKRVYFEECETIGEAIKREKQIKGGSRKKKIELISGMNPEWNDLSKSVDGE